MVRLRIHGWSFALSFCYFVLLVNAQVTDPSEVSGLLAVRYSLIDPRKRLSDWDKGDPCTSKWTGISCYDTVGADFYLHVRDLQLLNRNLSGSLAPEISQLSHLEILDFMWNELTGGIPKEIGSIAPLKFLLLNGNKLSGSLPDELGSLSNLSRLQLDQNQISGPIPKSFANLTRMKHLHLNNNSLNGQIPSELSALPILLHLLLDNNNLSGVLPPEFSKFPDLRIIQLDNNNFNGTEIPASYGNLLRLVKISLRNCSLKGPVPDLSKIPHLSYIDLSENQLSGPIPSNKLSVNMTTIDLSDNHINGSIPGSFSNLPSLQKLDFQNNSVSSISEDFFLSENVTLRLLGNPICNNAKNRNMSQYCGPETRQDEPSNDTTNWSAICPIQSCPTDNYFEYVPESPVKCFCASPIRIEYRLKSPSFSYFNPYMHLFMMYVTSSLNLELYQLSIGSFSWEKGPRLRMYLKLFPAAGLKHTFNESEVLRIRDFFATWEFPGSDFFGPYELLNFILIGPYSSSAVNPLTPKGSVSKGALIAVILAAVVCAVIVSTIITFFITKRHAAYIHKWSRQHSSSRASIKIDGVKSFTFKDVALATDNFNSSAQVGQGGYGKVYKGVLLNNVTVAIKRATEGSLQGKKEFLTEIELLSRVHHRNLVSLVGYCGEKGEQMLVYEFMPNGTLKDWISVTSKQTLDFGLRLHIALGSAKGILYLHTEAHPPIFHRDIKASNILLDSNFTAKVADFGLSRLAPLLNDEGAVPDHVSTIVKGTPGYLDPEYLLTRKLTDKSDVYSLGVVFLEILTGMKPISHGKNIVQEVNLAHQSGTMFTVIDSKMGSYPTECVERFMALALRCCQDKPEDRPSMLEVVRELENILQMTPEAVLDSSGSKSRCFSESASSPSLVYASGDPFTSLNVSGSNLNSSVTPTITPR